ncbi:hypothetical protein CRM22_006659 [Opisthorchis felineus]|uniref:Uncharacterized protein n=1 Tax=Opisthorchis felineus TaxID=147828 RepID=A0A4S2LJX5_OPIFE|nr:hypothetical protein CRM22_006659 [Opisthorchis felineus]
MLNISVLKKKMRNTKSRILEGTPLISGPPTNKERSDQTAHLKRNVVKSSNLATLSDKEVMSSNKPSADHLQRTDSIPTKTGNSRESRHISFRGTKYDTVYVEQSSPSLQGSQSEAELLTKSGMESTVQAYSASKFKNGGRESGYSGHPPSSFHVARGVTKEEQLRLMEIRRAKLLSRIHELLTNVDQPGQPGSTAETAEHTELKKLYPAKEDLIVPRVASYWDAKSTQIEEGRKLLKARRALHVIQKSQPPAMPAHYRGGPGPQAEGGVIKNKTPKDDKNIRKTDKSTEIDEWNLEDDQYICHGKDKAVQTQFINPRQRRRFSDAVEITVRTLSRPTYTMKVVADESGLRAVREDIKIESNRTSLAVGTEPEPQLRYKGLQPATNTDENLRNKRASSTVEVFLKQRSVALDYVQSLRASEVPKREDGQYKDRILQEANGSADLIQRSSRKDSGEGILDLSDHKRPESTEDSVPVMHNLRSSFGTLVVSVDAQPSKLEKTAVDDSRRGDREQPQDKKAASLSDDLGPTSEQAKTAELDFSDYKRFENSRHTIPVDRLLTQPPGEVVASYDFERSQGDKTKFGEPEQDSDGPLRQLEIAGLVGDIGPVAKPEGHGEDIPLDRLDNKQSETEESLFSLGRATTPDRVAATESFDFQLPKAETTDVYQLSQENGNLLQEEEATSPTGSPISEPKLEDQSQESVLTSLDRNVSDPSESTVSIELGLPSPSESSAMMHDSQSSEMERIVSYKAGEESDGMPKESNTVELTEIEQDVQHLETGATPDSDQTAPASNERSEREIESDEQGDGVVSTALTGEPEYTTISAFDEEF